MARLNGKRFAQVLVCGATFVSPLAGQTDPDSLEGEVEEVLESTLDVGTRDVEDSQYAEILLQLSSTPLDLNSATTEELCQVPSISPLLAARIISFRNVSGFNSTEDLLSVQGIDRTLYSQVRPFLTVGSGSPSSRDSEGIRVRYTGRTISRLREQRAFVDGTYWGSPFKIYNRLGVQYPISPDLVAEAGGLTEKDAGEKNVTDFLSGYVGLSNSDRTFSCLIGDFVVETGQGLALWRSSGPTKGSEVISTLVKNPRGIQPYRSSDENGFFRGGAAQVRWGYFDFMTFVSRKSINARISDQGSITGFDLGGLSRNAAEEQTRATSSETILGASGAIRLSELRFGIRTYTSRFDNPVHLAGVVEFQGRGASMTSVDFSYESGTVASVGECAIDRSGSIAVIGGLLLQPLPLLGVAFMAHNYAERFTNLHGFGFGESGNTQNERGVYASAQAALFDRLSVSAYFDQFASIGSTSISLLPSHGNEFLGSMMFEASEQTTLHFQYRQKNQADAQIALDSFSRVLTTLGERIQTNYRTWVEWTPTPSIRWKTRFETVRVQYSSPGSAGSGILFYQDLRIKPLRRLTLDFRVVTFDTDSYDSRLYEYESELSGTFANPALYGKGVRLYILGRYRRGRLEFSAKYSSTLKPGVRSLGTGPNEIQGDLDDQIGLQIDVRI